MREHLYFIAIVPPDDVSGQITEMKKHIAEKYGSKHALRSPPHITLHMPFKWKESKMERLTEAMEHLASSQQTFDVVLDGFDAFAPRVVYVAVRPSAALSECFDKTKKTMRSLHVLNANYKDRPFHPHVTIGFRDLKKPMFEAAWAEYREKQFSAEFRANDLVLLQHQPSDRKTQGWQVLERYPMRA